MMVSLPHWSPHGGHRRRRSSRGVWKGSQTQTGTETRTPLYHAIWAWPLNLINACGKISMPYLRFQSAIRSRCIFLSARFRVSSTLARMAASKYDRLPKVRSFYEIADLQEIINSFVVIWKLTRLSSICT